MRARSTLGLAAALLILIPLPSLADPPAHAPAHGYRAKQKSGAVETRKAEESRKGIEIVYDSERGIHVGVDLPDVFFYEGRYYREQEGRWQVSVSGDGGWSLSASSSVPEGVVKAKQPHPGPAKAKTSKGWKNKKK